MNQTVEIIHIIDKISADRSMDKQMRFLRFSEEMHFRFALNILSNFHIGFRSIFAEALVADAAINEHRPDSGFLNCCSKRAGMPPDFIGMIRHNYSKLSVSYWNIVNIRVF